LTGFFVPLGLVYFGRFSCEPSVLNILYVTIIQGYRSFSWYCRLVQGPLSVLTWTNVNFQLCFPETHPLFLHFGKWFLLAGELCVIPLSFGFIKGIHLLASAVRGNKEKKM
jgi:hypothetical protein